MCLKVFSLSGCINGVWLFFWFIWRASSFCNVSSRLSWSLYITGYTTILRNVRNLDIVYQDTSVYFCIMSNLYTGKFLRHFVFTNFTNSPEIKFCESITMLHLLYCPCGSFFKNIFHKIIIEITVFRKIQQHKNFTVYGSNYYLSVLCQYTLYWSLYEQW